MIQHRQFQPKTKSNDAYSAVRDDSPFDSSDDAHRVGRDPTDIVGIKFDLIPFYLAIGVHAGVEN